MSARIKEFQLPYAIRFSYGLTTLDEGYRSVREMVEHSDALMYETKAKLAGREKDLCKEQERTVNALCLRNMRAIIICKVIITSL